MVRMVNQYYGYKNVWRILKQERAGSGVQTLYNSLDCFDFVKR